MNARNDRIPPKDEALNLTYRQRSNIAHKGRNAFYSQHAALERIMDVEIKQGMSFHNGDMLRLNLTLTETHYLKHLEDMLELANLYKDYFGQECISCLETVVGLVKEATVPEDLETAVTSSAAYHGCDPLEKRDAEISLSSSTVEQLRDYQAKLLELRDALGEVKRKLVIIGG